MSKIASRVAARWLRANGDGAEAEAVAQDLAQAPAATVSKLPKSGPGMDMFKGMMEKLNDAYADGDGEAFGKALDALYRSHDRLNP